MRPSWSAVGSLDGHSHLPLDLHFLLTAWADNAEDEHQIIGRAMQAIETVGALSGPLLYPTGDWEPGEAVQLYLEDMATDDLMRTFDSLQCDFRLSVPYVARIVMISGSIVPDGAEGAAPVTVPPPDATRVIVGVQPHDREPVPAGLHRDRLAPGRGIIPVSALGGAPPLPGVRLALERVPEPYPVPAGAGAIGNYDVGIGLPAVARNGVGRFAITYCHARAQLTGRSAPVRHRAPLRPAAPPPSGPGPRRRWSPPSRRRSSPLAADPEPGVPPGAVPGRTGHAGRRHRRPRPGGPRRRQRCPLGTRLGRRRRPWLPPSAGRTATTGASSCSS